VLVYQLLTGVLPFGKLESHNDLAEYTKRGDKGAWDRATLSMVPDGQSWEQLIEGCLVPDFKRRLQTVNDVLRLVPQQRGAVKPVAKLEEGYRPAAYTHGYQLRMLQAEEHGRVFDLSAMVRNGRRILTVGRQPDSNVFIKSVYSDYVSRRHCTIEASADHGQWVVRDGQWNGYERQWMLSRNGTYVNSVPVSQSGFYLKPGDIISIGDVTMRFENY
jgi:hypothetical protein